MGVCILATSWAQGAFARQATSEAMVTGTVRSTNGEPLAGALVQVNRCSEAAVIDFESLKSVTDKDGRYTLNVRFRDGDALWLRELWVSHDGFVRYDEAGAGRVRNGDTLTVDFTLTPGKIIEGRIDVPLIAMVRAAGGSADAQRHVFQVVGSNFRQTYLTDPGGAFKVYVPAGTYAIEVLDADLRLSDVAAGSRGLLLKKKRSVLTPASLRVAFDALVADMDRNYSYFIIRDIYWPGLAKEFRPKAVQAESLRDFVAVLRQMLSRLEDMHIWIDGPDGRLSTHQIPRRRNWNPKVILEAVAERVECGDFATVGRIQPERYGCVIIKKQSAATLENVNQTVQVIRALADAPGFIVDLRGGCSGGDERLAQVLASAFCDEEVVYAKNKYRSGPNYDDFGPELLRMLPRGDAAYTRPVVCLIGHKCMSSGEALVKMFKALPHATTVGARTRGASGNPRPFDLPGIDVTVWYSRWVDMQPDGTIVEGRGIEPDVAVDVPGDAYNSDDPTWRRGLEILRERTVPNRDRKGAAESP